ncbi:MAG TPA: DUF411 domain-containing protein [Gammaproteobacteria bacterium]|nr:DUF411 domain-containing protein [Gammaproteobacteria bacterium]
MGKSVTTGKFKARLIAAFSLLTILGGVSVVMFMQKNTAVAADIEVFKSPTCGCCNKWVAHLKENGFKVAVHNRKNMQQVKVAMGVPHKLESCHTAKVGDYLIEGHVPADVIARMIREKPAIKGLSVPGMPMGSPGMEGPVRDQYNVLAFQADGKTEVYESR